jgi:hypothetical protein
VGDRQYLIVVITLLILEKGVKMSERKLPFSVVLYDKEPVEVTNKFSGASCVLEPDAVAVYDTIMGGNITENWEVVRQGCDWFRKHFPSEYMILLD